MHNNLGFWFIKLDEIYFMTSQYHLQVTYRPEILIFHRYWWKMKILLNSDFEITHPLQELFTTLALRNQVLSMQKGFCVLPHKFMHLRWPCVPTRHRQTIMCTPCRFLPLKNFNRCHGAWIKSIAHGSTLPINGEIIINSNLDQLSKALLRFILSLN